MNTCECATCATPTVERPLLFYVLVPLRMSEDNPALMPTQSHWCGYCVKKALQTNAAGG
jgi:hypothetical protein